MIHDQNGFKKVKKNVVRCLPEGVAKKRKAHFGSYSLSSVPAGIGVFSAVPPCTIRCKGAPGILKKTAKIAKKTAK
jgi:hypothetical protein